MRRETNTSTGFIVSVGEIMLTVNEVSTWGAVHEGRPHKIAKN